MPSSVQNAVEIHVTTTEEALTEEALFLTKEVLDNPAVRESPLATRVMVRRVRSNLAKILEVVSDYGHMTARIEELEAEVARLKKESIVTYNSRLTVEL